MLRFIVTGKLVQLLLLETTINPVVILTLATVSTHYMQIAGARKSPNSTRRELYSIAIMPVATVLFADTTICSSYRMISPDNETAGSRIILSR